MTLHIGSLFHIAHVVDDLDAAEQFYDRVFAPEYMFRGNHSTIEGRDASILIFADYVCEPMAPIDTEWLPPTTTGSRPRSSHSPTAAATRGASSSGGPPKARGSSVAMPFR